LDASITSSGSKATRAALLAVAAISLLAAVETAVALIAPARAPTDADWTAAAAEVRAGFRPGDLIVAAPRWADAILRVHLGDLIPAEVAGRLDDERFGRVWEVSQRGARAAETAGAPVISERRAGRLTVRLVERPAAAVGYDFVASWADARVSRRSNAGAGAGSDVDCENTGDRIQCPGIGYNFVRPQMVEVDQRLRRALLAQPVPQSTVVIEYPMVQLGRTLVVATGLHHTWMRKEASGPVDMRVVVGTEADVSFTTGNDDGWVVHRIDTSARAGKLAVVRFEITSPQPYARHFAFAAEVRE
jgi:hypothetical protein